MLLRVIRGRVLPGRSHDFVEVCRQQVAEGARSVGLLTFMGGYRRVGGVDEFVLASSWESEEAATSVTGDDTNLRAALNLRDVATIESVERSELHAPIFRGILDAPGAVIRVIEAKLRPGMHDALFSWLDQKEREIRATRLVLGWIIGDRVVDGEQRIVSIAAWPSPLMIEALTETGREGQPIFAALDEFVSDVSIAQYQSIEVELPSRLADVGSRRILAARFDSESAANDARETLTEAAATANEAGVSVARLASDRASGDDSLDSHVLVARVSLAEYPLAERMIGDAGGQIILAADEKL
jgi:hypothetical protein